MPSLYLYYYLVTPRNLFVSEVNKQTNKQTFCVNRRLTSAVSAAVSREQYQVVLISSSTTRWWMRKRRCCDAVSKRFWWLLTDTDSNNTVHVWRLRIVSCGDLLLMSKHWKEKHQWRWSPSQIYSPSLCCIYKKSWQCLLLQNIIYYHFQNNIKMAEIVFFKWGCLSQTLFCATQCKTN